MLLSIASVFTSTEGEPSRSSPETGSLNLTPPLQVDLPPQVNLPPRGVGHLPTSIFAEPRHKDVGRAEREERRVDGTRRPQANKDILKVG